MVLVLVTVIEALVAIAVIWLAVFTAGMVFIFPLGEVWGSLVTIGLIGIGTIVAIISRSLALRRRWKTGRIPKYSQG